MKIAFVTSDFYPGVSGVSRLTQELASYLSKNNEVVVYTFNLKNPKEYEEEKVGKVLVKRYSFYTIFADYKYAPDLLPDLKKSECDIIHSHHYGYYPAVAGLKAALKKKVPHVFSTYFHPPLSSKFIKIPFALYNFFYGIPLFRKSKKVLVFSNQEKELLLKFGAEESNIERFPNPVNTKFFRPCHAKDKNPKTVLFMHRLIEHKGMDKFLKMAREIVLKRSDVRFVIGGEGPLRSMEKELSKDEKKRIEFIGEIPEKDLPKWYSRSSVFVLPTRYESFGLVLAEAMACGTPVVTTKVGAIPELVVKGTGFLFEFGQWEKMKQLVEYIIDNNLDLKMKKKCVSYVNENYSTELLGARLLKIYESLL